MGVRHIDSCYFFFFKQKTAYEMRISDWSSDVCSSDLSVNALFVVLLTPPLILLWRRRAVRGRAFSALSRMAIGAAVVALAYASLALVATSVGDGMTSWIWLLLFLVILTFGELWIRSEEHTSELQSLMRISYAVFCLKKKKKQK